MGAGIPISYSELSLDDNFNLSFGKLFLLHIVIYLLLLLSKIRLCSMVVVKMMLISTTEFNYKYLRVEYILNLNYIKVK